MFSSSLVQISSNVIRKPLNIKSVHLQNTIIKQPWYSMFSVAHELDEISRDTCDHTKCPCSSCDSKCEGYSIGVAIIDDIDTKSG